MATTLLILLAIWAVTFPAVLGLGGLLSRVSGPRSVAPEAQAATEPRAPGEEAEVVPLVPRPQNGLVALRRAA